MTQSGIEPATFHLVAQKIKDAQVNNWGAKYVIVDSLKEKIFKKTYFKLSKLTSATEWQPDVQLYPQDERNALSRLLQTHWNEMSHSN